MEQRKKTKGKNPWRFAFAALGIWGGLELLSYLAAWLIGDVLGGISFSVPRASTIGIIGGADGPTAIFVTAVAKPDWQLLLWLLMTAVGIWGFLRLRKQK